MPPTMRSLPLLLLALQGLFQSANADTRICRFPGGKVTDDVPCTSNQNTHCCSPSSICLDNGYCYNIARQPFGISRGTCTDESWGKNCPQECIDADKKTNKGSPIVAFTTQGDDQLYCCGGLSWDANKKAMDCAGGADPFTLDSARAILGVAALTNTTLDTENYYTAGVNASQVSVAKHCDNSGNDGKNGTDGSNGDSDSKGGNNGTCSTDGSNGNKDDSKEKTAIGAGVGVPLGIIALGSLAFAFLQNRQFRRLKAQSQYATQEGMMGSLFPMGHMGHMGQMTHVEVGHQTYPAELDNPPRELMGTSK
ncbi:hypothetical protein EYZ11_004901 [Aspergillus tanneri]|uniref:Mid2 domain-containing protein n=1 Tax=Aspergillus tanneri TaxID=1220188 RepID=A0A4S3JJB0_9EURO|nr:uncharacterized protein ATNIH1004_000519 [Aspergillus tanneri]KAA8651628.1 hypothetical protein ATNIH1004_000519 [Aspergillus tanneri]THC95639.1 hypothetical protein EYZ11_004901 [Aspergillus tanneri]